MTAPGRPSRKDRAQRESASTTSPPREVPCPTCGSMAVYGPENPWRPFCSERCRRIDLGAWASERYRVPAKPEPDDDEPPAQ